MNAIRIRQRIESENLHIPEVRPLIGRDVEIIILDEQAQPATGDAAAMTPSRRALEAHLDALGTKPVERFEDLLGPAPVPGEDNFDGFDEWLEERRRTEVVPEFKEP
jgi:hypothetical protein